jgi:Skp family chaperone for outer membrane proteins
MKTVVVALSCLTGVVVSFAAATAGGGKAATPTPGVQSIGVVRVVDILQGLSEVRKHGNEIKADQGKAQAELDALTKEIEIEEGELATLKRASIAYLKQSEAVAEKKAHYSAHKELLERQILLKQQLWTQKAYGEIVRVTREVAAEKGLSLILVKDDPNVNAAPPEAITTLIATYKVLCSDGCPDITQEVQAKLIAAQP